MFTSEGPTPALLEAIDGSPKDGHVADTPFPIAPEVKGFGKGRRQAAPSPARSVEEVPLRPSATSHARC